MKKFSWLKGHGSPKSEISNNGFGLEESRVNELVQSVEALEKLALQMNHSLFSIGIEELYRFDCQWVELQVAVQQVRRHIKQKSLEHFDFLFQVRVIQVKECLEEHLEKLLKQHFGKRLTMLFRDFDQKCHDVKRAKGSSNYERLENYRSLKEQCEERLQCQLSEWLDESYPSQLAKEHQQWLEEKLRRWSQQLLTQRCEGWIDAELKRLSVPLIFSGLRNAKPLMTKLVLTILLESIATGLIPVATKMLLTEKSLMGISVFVLICATSVTMLVYQFQQQATFTTCIASELIRELATVVGAAPEQHSKKLQDLGGRFHTSNMTQLASLVAVAIGALQSICIVLAQQIGILLAFGFVPSLISLLGLALMIAFVILSGRVRSQFSRKEKRLREKTNHLFLNLSEKVSLFQSMGTVGMINQCLERVLELHIALHRQGELKRAMIYGAPRIVPQAMCLWVVLYMAVSSGASSPELAMLIGFTQTTMQVSYSGMLYFTQLPDFDGDRRVAAETKASPKRPEGVQVIDSVDGIVVSDLRVHLPGGKTLWKGGLLSAEMDELHIRPSEILYVIGESGAGKSHLLQILGRKLENYGDPTPQFTGETYWTGKCAIVSCGQRIPLLSTKIASYVQRFAFAPQHTILADGLQDQQINLKSDLDRENDFRKGTVADNLGHFLHNPDLDLNLSLVEQEELVLRVAEMVLLHSKLDQDWATLSGGERDLCKLGMYVMCLLLGADVLLLDEPYAHVNNGLAKVVHQNVVRYVQQHQKILIVVSHNDVLNFPDRARVCVLGRDEGIIEQGTVRQLRDTKGSEYNRVLRIREDRNTRGRMVAFKPVRRVLQFLKSSSK